MEDFVPRVTITSDEDALDLGMACTISMRDYMERAATAIAAGNMNAAQAFTFMADRMRVLGDLCYAQRELPTPEKIS